MNIPPIQAVSAGPAAAAIAGATEPSQAAAGPSFTELVQQAIGQLNDSLNVADELAMRLSAGEPVDLHQVMIAMEMAGIGLQTATQVRNRLVEAYKEIMAMPV
ncbi:MAG: flagellar hook-basal body complex protein FliE [Sphaerobacter sp.]|nr:flagellar hook-basal body complex protein FliE [Sphaerobacter sp.]